MRHMGGHEDGSCPKNVAENTACLKIWLALPQERKQSSKRLSLSKSKRLVNVHFTKGCFVGVSCCQNEKNAWCSGQWLCKVPFDQSLVSRFFWLSSTKSLDGEMESLRQHQLVLSHWVRHEQSFVSHPLKFSMQLTINKLSFGFEPDEEIFITNSVF